MAGKYPINLALGLTNFPLVGLEYDLNLTANNMSSQQKTDLNDLYLLLGVGCRCPCYPDRLFPSPGQLWNQPDRGPDEHDLGVNL